MQRIPLVDLKIQYLTLKSEIDKAVLETMAQTAFIMGERVAKLEKDFAKFCHADFGIGVSSATCGLHLVLHALEIGPGDEVIIPSHTFIATAEAVCHSGATPIFADVIESTNTIDPAHVESLITSKTRAIMPVHLYGRCADMEVINKIAETHGLHVIEDAAQAHGAYCSAGRAGSLGVAAVFSFYPGKNLGAFGDGGMITTNDRDLYEKMHMLANHGRTSKYLHEMIGYNYRLDAIQAAIVRIKLDHLNKWNASRLRLARRYNEAFSDLHCVTPDAPDSHVFHLYELRVANRDQLLATFQSSDIGAGIHYPVPCHQQPCFEFLPSVSLPITETLVQQIVSLPIFPEMTNEQQDRVIEIVVKHCSQDPLSN